MNQLTTEDLFARIIKRFVAANERFKQDKTYGFVSVEILSDDYRALVECAEVARAVGKWLSEPRLTTYAYTESSDFYLDKCRHEDAIKRAITKLEAL